MKVPKDEMMLAELIAVASAHGLRSCRGAAFRDKKGYCLGGYGKRILPPDGAVSCCAIGASCLLPTLTLSTVDGNDARLGRYMPDYGGYNVNRYNRDWNIGAAFEMALRGSDE